MIIEAQEHSTKIKSPSVDGSGKIMKAFRLIFGLIILLFLLIYCFFHRGDLLVLLDVRWHILALIYLLALFRRFFAAGRFRKICKPLRAVVPFRDAYLLTMVSSAINLVTPFRGGFAARSVYLKQTHRVPFSQMPGLALGSTFLAVGVGGVLLLSTNFMGIVYGLVTPWQLWLLACLMCMQILGFLIPLPERFLKGRGHFGRWLCSASEGWNALRTDRKSLFEASTFHLAIFLISTCIVMASFYSINIPLSLHAAVSIAVFASCSGIANLTPSNLGVQELVVAYFARLSGETFAGGIAAALIMRAVSLSIDLVGGTIGYYILFVKKPNHHADTTGADEHLPVVDKR